MLKRRSIPVWLAACLGMVCLAVGLGIGHAQAQGPQIVLKVSHDLPSTSRGTKVVMADKFKELVESRSRGRIAVQIHPGGELYNDPDGLVATSKANIASQVVSSDALTVWEPGVEVFSMYGLFDNREHCARFLAHKDGGQEIFKRLEKKRLIVRLYVSGPWLLWTKDKVANLEALKGMAIRTSLSRMEASCIQALGCKTFPLPVDNCLAYGHTCIIYLKRRLNHAIMEDLF